MDAHRLDGGSKLRPRSKVVVPEDEMARMQPTHSWTTSGRSGRRNGSATWAPRATSTATACRALSIWSWESDRTPSHTRAVSPKGAIWLRTRRILSDKWLWPEPRSLRIDYLLEPGASGTSGEPAGTPRQEPCRSRDVKALRLAPSARRAVDRRDGRSRRGLGLSRTECSRNAPTSLQDFPAPRGEVSSVGHDANPFQGQEDARQKVNPIASYPARRRCRSGPS